MGQEGVILRDPQTGRLLPGSAPLHNHSRAGTMAKTIRAAVERSGKSMEAIAEAVVGIVFSPTASNRDRTRAAEFLYDRVFGRPVAPVEGNFNVNQTQGGQRAPSPAEGVSTDRLRAIAAIMKGGVVDAASSDGIALPASGVRVIDANATDEPGK